MLAAAAEPEPQWRRALFASIAVAFTIGFGFMLWSYWAPAPGRPGIDPGTFYNPATSAEGWFTCPDNVAFDSKGRLWIASDSAEVAGTADGLYACDVSGPGRALTRQFFVAPQGAEVYQGGKKLSGRTPMLIKVTPGEPIELVLKRKRYKDTADLASALANGEMLGYEHMSSGGMGEVQTNMSKLPEADVAAIAEYLVSLK